MARVTKDDVIAQLRAELAAAQTKIESGYEPPTPVVPADNEVIVNGYIYGTYGVELAWRRGHLTGRRRHIVAGERPESASQLIVPIYRTPREAAIAYRLKIEKEAQTRLSGIDEDIAKLD